MQIEIAIDYGAQLSANGFLQNTFLQLIRDKTETRGSVSSHLRSVISSFVVLVKVLFMACL